MSALRFLCAVLLVSAGAAFAQSQGEITFWETVRDSKNPAELRAYLQAYPNGAFKPIAEARLAALEAKPVAPQSPSAPAAAAPGVSGPPHHLRPGDAWTYRLTYPRLRGEWGQSTRPASTHVVTLDSAENGHLVDSVSVDGGKPVSSSHAPGPSLLYQGVAIFSPYLLTFEKRATGRLPAIAISEPGCERTFLCEAKGRIAGTETVQVAAGRFVATKVVVEQEWRPRAMSGQSGGRYNGGRTLTIWYAPEIGRAVKYSSRLVVGDFTPMDVPNFDLELTSYKLK